MPLLSAPRLVITIIFPPLEIQKFSQKVYAKLHMIWGTYYGIMDWFFLVCFLFFMLRTGLIRSCHKSLTHKKATSVDCQAGLTVLLDVSYLKILEKQA